MGKYFCIVEGKALDWRYKKMGDDHIAFYIGDIYVGQVWKIFKSYSVVGKNPHPLCPIDGFRTRHDACEMLLKLEGYRPKDDYDPLKLVLDSEDYDG